jgi:hypothetical protein
MLRLQDSWDDVLWSAVDSGMGAGPTDKGFLGRVQHRSESALAFFIPVQLFCAGLLVPVYLAVLVRCFIIADAEIPFPAILKPTRKQLPDPDDPALIISFSLAKEGAGKQSLREVFKHALGSVYFTLLSVTLVAVRLERAPS